MVDSIVVCDWLVSLRSLREDRNMCYLYKLQQAADDNCVCVACRYALRCVPNNSLETGLYTQNAFVTKGLMQMSLRRRIWQDKRRPR